MNKYEIIVDKVKFIKQMAEKYDLIYEEHKQEHGEKDFSLYLDEEYNYRILNYDTFFYGSYSVLQYLAIDFRILETPTIKLGDYHSVRSNEMTEQYIKTLKYTFNEFIRIKDFIIKSHKAENKLKDIENDF